MKSRPELQFSRLEQPVIVSAASPSASLKAVGIMQVPILFENRRSATFSMLVVPDLSWPILFGQNHLRMTDAHIKSRELKVYFADRKLGFEVNCKDSNPVQSFPKLCFSKNGPASTANVTCLLTAMPTPTQPCEPISLHRGLSFVTVCLMLAASLVGSPYFSASGDLWLEGNQLLPGVNTVSGPMNFSGLSHMIQLADHASPHFSVPSHPKCRPSRPIPTVGSQTTDMLAEISPSVDSFSDIPQSQDYFYTTVVIHSTRESATLPFNTFLGSVRSIEDADHKVLESAAEFTASQVANHFFAMSVNSQASPDPVLEHVSNHVQTVSPSRFNCSRAPKISHAQESQGVESSGLDSSILAPYLETAEFDNDKAFPFTGTGKKSVQPFSEEFFCKLLDALDLDAPSYSHVPRSILQQFKSLLHKYQHVFHLPDSPFSTIQGFFHNIPTGDSPPVYRLPYRKSPEELAAIKTEIERMLKLQIVQPSHSAWGAPCILVRKPLEKGKPQPPRFVVDYRGLNAVTSGDGYPIPSVANILDAISGGKLFAKLDLASGYWQIPVNPKHRHKTAFATHLGLWEF